ncbi:MAG: aconitase/3-isopropylmalate dehydratase large subunit family protein, partial [Anaerolineae bacterium]|nr:aconitase/3-isopropylmalate dehydratase large subunit family protein [Anaerolineae bacterium]
MPYTFAEKALARAAGLRSAVVGQIVDVTPDVALSHDNTAAIARIFRSLGAERVKHPERLAITLDHAVPAPTTLHATNHAEVRRFVAEQGIRHFFEAGRGICHQVLSEEALVLPGQTVLGADSHTTHFGWLGAFGAGIGRSEMAAIWATGQLWLRVPETIRVDLVGELPPGVTAKDLSLVVLQMLGEEAGIYRALEFGGPGLATLSLESRMVIPNMMAEAGAKSAYLPPDEAVFRWLAERLVRRREGKRRERRERRELGELGEPEELGEVVERLRAMALYPDPDATYVARYEVNLSALEPVVACPHHPANVAPLSQVAGTRVDQAFLGTCTNGRLEDLAEAAAVLRAPDGRVRRVAPGTRLLVIPASSEVLQAALAAGYLETFLQAGAMIGTPGCGPCMGNHMGIPAPGEVTISSANRNFRGRMGTAESEVYLASPAVVAASAVLGRIADPREVIGDGKEERKERRARRDKAETQRWWRVVHERPEVAAVPQAALAGGRPAGRRQAADGPGLADPADGAGAPPHHPTNLPIHQPTDHLSPSAFSGRAWKYGDNVNTDVIFPGKYTYTLREPSEWAKHALEDLDPTFAANVQPGDIIVAGR